MMHQQSYGPGRPLKVLHYLGASNGIGGTEHYVLTLCEYLAHAHHQVDITCATPRGPEFTQRAAMLGVPIHEFSVGPGNKYRYLHQTLALARLLQRKHVHVMHIHAAGYSGLNAFVAAKLAGTRAVVVTHHQRFDPLPASAYERLVLLLQKRWADRIVAAYAGQAAELQSAGISPRRVAVIHTGIDVVRFNTLPPKGANDAASFRLIIAARFQEGKGHRELLSALAQLAGRYPQLRLLIVGDGDLRAEIETHIRILGLEHVVALPGWIPADDLPAIMRSAQVTVLPTSIPSETTPLALIEGMASGLAAIGTRTGGIPEIIVDNCTGFLVDIGDIAGLALAIERLVQNPERAAEMGQYGRRRVEEQFSAEYMTRSYLKLYAEALSS